MCVPLQTRGLDTPARGRLRADAGRATAACRTQIRWTSRASRRAAGREINGRISRGQQSPRNLPRQRSDVTVETTGGGALLQVMDPPELSFVLSRLNSRSWSGNVDAPRLRPLEDIPEDGALEHRPLEDIPDRSRQAAAMVLQQSASSSSHKQAPQTRPPSRLRPPGSSLTPEPESLANRARCEAPFPPLITGNYGGGGGGGGWWGWWKGSQ